MWIRVEGRERSGHSGAQGDVGLGFWRMALATAVWRCDVENAASARTAEKAGMSYEGIVRWNLLDRDNIYRDMRFYGMFREDWAPA